MLRTGVFCFAVLFLVLLVNTGYIAAFPTATVFYMANVLGHVVLGALLAIALLFIARRIGVVRGAPLAVGLLLIAFILGAILTYVGNVRDNAWILRSHIATAVPGTLALIPWAWRKASPWFKTGFQFALILLVALPIAGYGYRRFFPNPHNRIVNPLSPPLAMEGEGGGPKSPFFPA